MQSFATAPFRNKRTLRTLTTLRTALFAAIVLILLGFSAKIRLQFCFCCEARPQSPQGPQSLQGPPAAKRRPLLFTLLEKEATAYYCNLSNNEFEKIDRNVYERVRRAYALLAL